MDIDSMNRSKQRDEIMEYLSSVKSHPTANEIFDNVRKVDEKISLATVYRNLAKLSESGMILKLTMGDGVEHYDADTSEHLHFICRECGRVEDLNGIAPLMLSKTIAEDAVDFTGRIEGQFGYFYGTCGCCLVLEKEA